MQQLQPEQAVFLLNTIFLPELKNEHRITKTVIGAVPTDKADYRPDEASMSAGDLAWHIAASEMAFLSSVVNGEFNPAQPSRPELAELTKWYEENFERRLDAVTKLSGEQLAKTIDFRGMFVMPAVMYLGFMQNHSIHHRGQLSAYLRPMGAKVPSMYGESYDAKQARKAAQQNA